MKPHPNAADPAAGNDAAVSCDTCAACCCRLEVMLTGDDDVPARFTAEDRWGGWVLRRLADGWCAALDRNTMRCTIYARRPFICRDYRMGGDDCRAERTLYLAGPTP
nr:YkgJ family cysteine cluster protein [Dechloromonas sp. H13]